MRLYRQNGKSTRWQRAITVCVVMADCLLLTAAAKAAVLHPASHVTTQDVMAAMVKRHLPSENAQVSFPAGITATVEGPILAVDQVLIKDAQTASLRMVCAVRGECPSFYVFVHWPQAPVNLAAAIEKAPTVSASEQATTGANTAMQKLHAGAHATLFIDQEKIHIRLLVVCTQSGGVGDRIRVITPNHQQTYEAVVLTDTEVQGEPLK